MSLEEAVLKNHFWRGDDYGCVKLLRFPSPFLNPGVEVGGAFANVLVIFELHKVSPAKP